ncbi:MAG: T9SS type A sorting domain-containing protein [Salibacteraceae bacterium]|nr:T9SS type A sorting domain-containing protein [Salibacteraceae bacterium]
MRFSLSILIFLFALSGKSQSGFHEGNTLVFSDNNPLKFSTAGGFDNPQFSEIDLNQDGVLDLFVFDRKYDVVRTFIYETASASYSYAPEYERFFPQGLHDFALLRDINCDGNADLFTFFQGGFRLYENLGTNQLSFKLKASKIQTKYGAINTSAFVLAGDVPAITDVDGDGDLDLLTFGTVGSENTIEFNKNLSIETIGSCDTLLFEVETQCWGNVQEPANQAVFEAVSCRGIYPPPPWEDRVGRIHPGSTVLAIDLDADGDKDLITGDIATKTLLRAINGGDASSANIDVTQQTNAFPNATNPVNMPYLVAGYEIDVDHDDIKDLVLSVNNGIDSSANNSHIWYYRNTSAGAPNYVLQTKNFLLDNMLDIGSSTVPVMIDINGDQRKDMLIAMDYKRTENTFQRSRIYAYLQDADGSFYLDTDNFSNLSFFNLTAISPTLGDLDNDGDLDMIIGAGDGFLHFVKNNGTAGIPLFSFTTPNYMNINTIGSNAAPTLADINDDGLLDLIVGERTGILSYFENVGTASSALFNSSPTIDSFGKIDISYYCCTGFSVPRVLDNPSAFGPGKYLMVGSDEKDIEIYGIADDLNAAFTRVDSIGVNAGKLAPLVEDIDNDGVFEIITGTAEGGLKYLERQGNYPWAISPVETLQNIKIFPNPASANVTISGVNSPSNFTIINLLGATISSGTLTQNSTTLSLEKMAAGHYILHVVGAKPTPLIIVK